MRHPFPRRLAALAAVALIGLSACGGDGEPQAQVDLDETSTTTERNTSRDDTDDVGPGTDTDTADVAFPDPDDVVAEATFTSPNSDGDEVRVGIESIVVTDTTMELRLVITPVTISSDDEMSVYDLLQNGTGVIPTTLIDREHLKEYTVLRDGGRRYETDSQLARARTGESVGYQRFFAAPEDDIDVIDVKVHDDLPVFEDVPLSFETAS